jgi:integrase
MQLVLLGFTAPPPPSPLTAYLDHRAQTCGPRTLALYRHILSRVERQLGGRPPDAASVAAYLRQYRAAAPDTQRNIYRALKAYCRWLVDAGHLAADPFAGPLGVARPRLPRRRRATSTEADILALLTAAAPRAGQRRRWAADGPRAREQPQSRALVLLLIDSAMRAEEVCRLTCGQARAERLVILGKGGHQDRAYIAEPTRRAIRDLAGDRPDDAPLFRDWAGGACSVAALRGILERLARRAGVTLPPRPLHSFRHYAAQQWARSGVPDLIIQRMMRHANIATTSIYTSGAREEDVAEVHQRVSPIAGLLAKVESQ